MNKSFLSITFAMLSFAGFAQAYEFQTIKDIECTPVISQGITGTCWSFSTTSFLEAEAIRLTGKKIDLSEMYSVRNTYPKKALTYVMRQGKAQFGEGALAHDVINSAKQYGLAPQSVYSGNLPGEETYNHAEMTAVLESMLKTYVSNPGKKLSPQWQEAISAVLDAYMGKNITEFNYEGKKYTPTSFMEMLKIKPENYVSLTSFTHQPYYSTFLLDIPDNFSNGTFMNVPLDEFMANIDNALENGFTLALDCDVSEKTFSAKNGVAVIPNDDADAKTILTEIKMEKVITPEFRQAEFENFSTTDDHLMHIVGKVKDQKGNIYYKVKNSWGSDSTKVANGGFVYMSVPYLKLKTISVLVHKDALESKTRKNLAI